MHFLPHLLGAAFATVILFYTSIRAITAYGNVKPIRATSIAQLGLLFLQLLFGFGA